MNLYDKQKHISICFKRINFEKIKCLILFVIMGGGGGLLKEDGSIKEGRDKKTIIEITEQVVFI
jgi:hypothetical protein